MKIISSLALAATLTATSLLASVPASTDFVIPVAGSGPGAFGSLWQTEVTLHNSGTENAPVTLTYHTAAGTVSSTSLTVPARGTVSVDDIVRARFGQDRTTGAISIDSDDIHAGKLAITSRTFNKSSEGEFGQSTPAVRRSDLLLEGDTGAIPGPRDTAHSRMGFGIFAWEASTVEWRLLRSDGLIAGTVEKTYPAGSQIQYDVAGFFGTPLQGNETIHARVKSGQVFVYGSIVDNRTNDPAYVQGIRTRENLRVLVAGIDDDENGTVDLRDANGDLVIDTPLVLSTSGFPNIFRLVATDPENQRLTFTLVNPSPDIAVLDQNGTIQWMPGAAARGTTGSLRVRISDGFSSVVVTIPVVFV